MAKYRWSVVWKNMVQNLPWALAPALTFVVYAAEGKDLDIAKAFSSMSIITLLTNPASKFLSTIPSIAAATGSFDRIQAFLLLKASPQHMKEGFVHCNQLKFDTLPQIVEAQYLTFKGSPDIQKPVISMECLGIRPSSSAKTVLKDINLEVPLGSLVIIRGQAGSGKSTLLRAILGQAFCETGFMKTTIRNPAFCAQTPWVPSGTIRDAVCGAFSSGPLNEGAFDKKWYATFLHACDLNSDLQTLREGDATQIAHGSSYMLSSGQIHRIALARAIYARRKLLLLDDIFSALDRKTRTTITSRLFGTGGPLRKADLTVVLSYVLSDRGICQEELYTGNHTGNVYQADPVEAAGSNAPQELPIEDKATMISKANKIDDLRRASGDFAVYKYYLRYTPAILVGPYTKLIAIMARKLSILLLISPDLFASIASAALIATGSKYMAISVPFLIIAVFLLQHIYLKISRQLRLLELESRSPLYSHLLDTLEGLATIQAFGWETEFRIVNSALLDVTQCTYYTLHCIQRWLTLVLNLIFAAEAVIVVSLAVGKSSLLLTLLGMLNVTCSSILIDNVDLATISPDRIREKIVTIPQTPLIMVGCTVSVEINDTLSLSRGEQQLLQFARALSKIQATNARILLIDEGTSSVDAETDARVKDLLQQDQFRACTVLTFAHRVHGLLNYDVIVGLDGKIVEMDEPMVLSNRKDSIFNSLLSSS
ncbi:P-loop containing nucleoside triphosphate hydrolase protein [Penicillium taxi]|uniref:P-loop containing nucleoside triphosphate hydrolase protein n=1 Tax=Penicillium taxi TaxID=168475 RepID=UPI0025455011|nr:P-loop containing nucleoside triphosphate hydrolase protein [Penicillium taxi]KAJ5887456.1 P-loop containing nucleoside triphosphate hydrolase protein [Penicillium taxi]